jgi:hypothetical protein
MSDLDKMTTLVKIEIWNKEEHSDTLMLLKLWKIV